MPKDPAWPGETKSGSSQWAQVAPSILLLFIIKLTPLGKTDILTTEIGTHFGNAGD